MSNPRKKPRVKLLKEVIRACWHCPLFNKEKQKCTRLNKYIFDKVLDEVTVDDDCPLEDAPEE